MPPSCCATRGLRCRSDRPPRRTAGGAECDSRGEFRTAPLPAGRYRVGGVLLDATCFSEGELPRAAPLPLLGNFDPVLPEVEVELRGDAASNCRWSEPLALASATIFSHCQWPRAGGCAALRRKATRHDAAVGCGIEWRAS